MKISRVVHSVSTGYQFRGRVEPDPKGDVGVLQVKDLRDSGGHISSDLVAVRIEKDIEPYRVRQGDVLFLSRGQRLAAVAVASVGERVIVPSYFYIVRPRRDVALPEYVAWFINSEKAQAQLRPVHAGTHMPIVSKSDFLELQVDLPPLRVQEAIVRLDALARRERRLQEELLDLKGQMIQQACARAASGKAKNAKGN